MKFEQYEYNICGAYLSAIINGDYSGLVDNEEAELNEFLDDVAIQHEILLPGHWSVDSEEPNFSMDDVSGLMDDCYECTYNVPIAEE